MGHHLFDRDFQQPTFTGFFAVVGAPPPSNHSSDRLRLSNPGVLTGCASPRIVVLPVSWMVEGDPGWFCSGDLTSFTSETIWTQAVKIIEAVIALCSVLAWLAGTVINVNSAETPFKACWALAREAVDTIVAGGTVGTGAHQAVIYVILAAGTNKASQALAGEITSKAIFILALPTIPAWKPARGKQGKVMDWG